MTDIEQNPTEEQLEIIRSWPSGEGEFALWMDYVHNIWSFADWGWRTLDGGVYYASTAGWSGNEQIIQAMSENKNGMWEEYWFSTRRGGHYVFCSRKAFPEVVRGEFLDTNESGELVKRKIGDAKPKQGTPTAPIIP